MKSNVNYSGSMPVGSSGIIGTEDIENGAITPEKLSKQYLSLQGQPIGTDVPNDGNVYIFTVDIAAPGAEESENVSYSFYRGYTTSDGEKTYKWESPIFQSDKITSENIEDKSITLSKLSDDIVSGGTITIIPDNSISTPKIQDEAVTTEKIVDGAVTLRKLGRHSVDTDIINNFCVTTDKLAVECVTTNRLARDSVTSEKIADESITTYKIKYGAVTPDRLSFYEYWSSPQEIGSYEGETVYRMIFHENFEQNNSIWTDKAWSPLLHNQNLFNDINKIFIINGLAFLKYSSTPCYIDDPVVHLHGSGCNFDWSEDQYNANYEGIYGYIEFVTPSDNLKTQE